MKKVLLSIMTLCASMAVNAQMQEGFHPEAGYAMDFVTTDISADKVYWWTQGVNQDSVVYVKVDSMDVDNDVCVEYQKRFAYKWTRNLGAAPAGGSIDYVLNQPYGLYQPVGVGFGEGNFLDISKENAYLGFKVTNNSEYPIILKVGLQDADTNLLNSMAKPNSLNIITPVTNVGNSYMEEIAFPLAAGASVDTVLNFNVSRLPTYAPYYADYAKDDCENSIPNSPTAPNPTRDRSFDYTRLAGATFTVVSGDPSPALELDGYKLAAIDSAKISISKFRVGTPYALGLNDVTMSKSLFSVHPNPVSNGVLHLNVSAENIQVVDVLGNVVLTSPSANQINVSSLHKGVYTLTSSKGAKRFVVE